MRTLARLICAALCLASAPVRSALLEEPTPTTVALPPSAPEIDLSGKTLTQCFELALKQAESIAIQDEVLNQSIEQSKQARGALMPTITGTASYLQQQAPNNATGSSVSPASQTVVRLNASQPLFRGLRDFAALRQTSAREGSNRLGLQEAARQLFYSTAAAYYDVLALTSDEFNYRNEIAINRKRLDDLNALVKIGRTQITDVLTQRANISSLEATLEATRGQLESSKETLTFLTGMNRATPLRDIENPSPKVGAIDAYLAGISKRPDVQRAEADLKSYHEGVAIAWGAHLPSLDLTGNYYLKRPGALSGVHWDVGLGLTVPIFQGGIVSSQTRQAEAVERQYGLQLAQTKRLAEQEIRQFHALFTADQKQIAKLAETADLAKKNYEHQIRDYRNGLVTNLDVLQSISSWQSAQRTLSRQQYTAKLDQARLEAASSQRKDIFIER